MLNKSNTPKQTPLVPFRFAPRNNPFAVPSGRYRGVVKSVTKNSLGAANEKTTIKFMFELTEDQNGPVDYLIRKQYTEGSPNYGELNSDLAVFLDPAEMKELETTGTEIDLADLIGCKVDVLVSTIQNKGYPEPFSKIDAIYPPGHLLPENDHQDPDDAFGVAA